MTTKLRPCPFCGGERLTVKREPRFGPDTAEDEVDGWAFYVWCLGCACHGPWQKSQTGAERWWNGL